MSTDKYQITITNIDNIFYGVLHGAEQGYPDFEITFDPLTVLCDLLDVVGYVKGMTYSINNNFLKSKYTEHPFLLSQKYQEIFEWEFEHTTSAWWFWSAVEILIDIIVNNQIISLSQFEVYKAFFNLQFTSKTEFEAFNPFFREYEFCEMNAGDYNADALTRFVPLSENNGLNINEMFELKKGSPIRHTYTCQTLEDIIFAVLQFLLLHGYKFNNCNHCGRYFATKTLKTLYCKRKSPYPKYEHHECEQAVRTITQKLKNRKNAAFKNLRDYYKNGVYIDFANEYYRLSNAVKDCSSVENLKELEVFLDKKNIKQNWYTAENKG